MEICGSLEDETVTKRLTNNRIFNKQLTLFQYTAKGSSSN